LIFTFVAMKKIFTYIILIGLLILSFLAFSIYNKVSTSVVEQDTIIFIKRNYNYDSLYTNLKEKGFINDEKIFTFLANKMNLVNKVRPGKFLLNEGTNTIDLIKKLRSGKQEEIKFVLNNINFKKDLAGKISSQLDIDSLGFLNFLNNEKILKELGYNKDNIMCQFIPNTYNFYWATKKETFFRRMEKEKDIFWNNSRTEKAKALGLSPDEVFILASIVEKEYKFGDERKRIAGVYLNRINKKMPLQADPTCKFAWGDLSLKRVLNIHTQNPHPYNTYYINGLPPGPICLPETSTIDAVLNAEKHSYIYFCAHYNLDGRHEFNKTLTAHNAAARKYQKALNKLKIYR